MANGLPAFMLQVVIEANTNDWLDFLYNITDYHVQIDAGTYDDMRAVAANLASKMDAAEPIGAPWLVTFGTDGKVTITPTVTNTFTLKWKTGVHGSDNAHDHCGDLLGFSDAADDSGSLTYTSDYQHQLAWYSEHGPPFDSRPRKKSIGPATFVAVSDKATRTTFGTHRIRREDLAWITKEKFFEEFADTNEAFETWWEEAAEGTPFAFYSSTDTWVDEGNFVLTVNEDEDLLDQVPRLSPGEELYSLTLRMTKQT
jgi:hypothetical protein